LTGSFFENLERQNHSHPAAPAREQYRPVRFICVSNHLAGLHLQVAERDDVLEKLNNYKDLRTGIVYSFLIAPD
jgi:hypothetical protein